MLKIDMTEDFEKIKQILINNFSNPIKINTYPSIIYIENFRIRVLEIKLNKINQIELIFDSPYKPEEFEIIKIIMTLLRKNKINFLYNELKFNHLNNINEEKTNPNLRYTTENLPKCLDATKYFYQMFNKKSSHYKKGILIYHNKQLIGVLKLVPKPLMTQLFDFESDIKTFLSFKIGDNQVPLKELYIYNTTKSVYLKIKEKIDTEKIISRGFFNNLFKKPNWVKINLIGQLPISHISVYLLENENITAITNKYEKIEIEKFKIYFTNLIQKEYDLNKNKLDFDAEIEL